MKLFISSDIEGTTGIVNWDEANIEKPSSAQFREQMTREVNAACEGALKAGAKEIVIKDAHGSARNIDASKLPKAAKLFRGWARNPLVMMAGLDETFDAVLFTGYHSAAGTNGNPLAHTMNGTNNSITINGETASEFTINAYIAAYFKVPVLFLSGDKLLCDSAASLNPNIRTVAVSEGSGNGSVSIHPDLAVDQICQQVFEAVGDEPGKCRVQLPESFYVEIDFKEHYMAYRGSFYPGAVQTSPKKVAYTSTDYLDVLKFLFFVL